MTTLKSDLVMTTLKSGLVMTIKKLEFGKDYLVTTI